MKKTVLFLLTLFFVLIFTSGCDISNVVDAIEEQSSPKIHCSISKQYADSIGFSYYVEGTCVNKGSKDYSYLQVEFICYDKAGNNLGTALDNTNNLLAGQTWKFKAMSLGTDASSIHHCDYHEVAGW